MPHAPPRLGPGSELPMNERRHPTVFPGFAEIQARRQQLAAALSARRAELGLSQTEVAARMGTSQSAVARLEAGSLDTRLSTLERYVAAVGARLVWQLEVDQAQPGESRLPGGRQGLGTP